MTQIRRMCSHLSSAAAIQTRVIGAIIMRELHTRFGRENIGYLWVVLEPLALVSVITALHLGSKTKLGFGMAPAPFYITGYAPFLMFRKIILRAGPGLGANSGLLYHRVITPLDIIFARALLEGAATMLALMLLLAAAAAIGMGNLPDRPLLFLGAIGLLFWLSSGLAFAFGAACVVSESVERIVQPALYVILVMSGSFFVVEWLPPSVRGYVLLNPLVHIFELIREGQFSQFTRSHGDPWYVMAWCLATSLGGLSALRAVRPHVVMG